MESTGVENPILNSPFQVPGRHFELGHHGPTGCRIPSVKRRRSRSGRRASNCVSLLIGQASFYGADGPFV